MLALHKPQTAMRDTLAFGPSVCPPHLFGGDVAEVVRGLKVHANTISHARLTSLEASFPRARDWIGDAPFNDLSRRFIEGGGGIAVPLAQIGFDFPDWLVVQGQDETLVALARFEVLWLRSYHAADAMALTITAFADKIVADILAINVARHPAAVLAVNQASLDVTLGLGRLSGVPALLISRPEADVVITPLPSLQSSLFQAIAAPISIGAMLEAASQDTNEDDLFSALIGLINAGALICEGESLC